MRRIRTIRIALSAFLPAAALVAGCTSHELALETDSQDHITMSHTAPARQANVTTPITVAELKLLQESLLFGPEDVEALRMSRAVLEDHTGEILEVWYGFVGSTPQLVESFKNLETGKPDGAYLAAVRVRFEQWILETAAAEYDQEWLDHQHEIGLRHHSTKKNVTDGADSVPLVPYRYLPALVYPVTATLKPFLEAGEHTAAEVERMHQAWIKSVLLQVILWTRPYVKEGEF